MGNRKGGRKRKLKRIPNRNKHSWQNPEGTNPGARAKRRDKRDAKERERQRRIDEINIGLVAPMGLPTSAMLRGHRTHSIEEINTPNEG